ncbi:MAG: diiron oxygenase [Acetobacteraceae bacterium]
MSDGAPETWAVPQEFAACFDWRLDAGRERLLALYERGKARQWNAPDRIDWSQDLDPENPQLLPPEALPLFGSPLFARLSRRERIEITCQHQAWTVSQFLHGEQGALICAAKTVQQVPDLDAKLYAATQVVDEARHVEVYQRLLGKFGIFHPMTRPLRELLDQVLRDARWDMTYLGMQVVIEGLALAAFARIRDEAQNPLAASVNAYVMEDEARHVAFGALSLREHYPRLTQPERDEREEFLIEACFLMRDRFDAMDLWESLDLPLRECGEYLRAGRSGTRFAEQLFSRIVPMAKSIGLWGTRAQRGFEQLGALHFAEVSAEAILNDDEAVARTLDARRAALRQGIAGAG